MGEGESVDIEEVGEGEEEEAQEEEDLCRFWGPLIVCARWW